MHARAAQTRRSMQAQAARTHGKKKFMERFTLGQSGLAFPIGSDMCLSVPFSDTILSVMFYILAHQILTSRAGFV
jgi:hypothetical protein